MASISRTPSIYWIRHIESGKVYVGSAVNPRNRWKNHRILLRKDAHHSRYLQNAWNKYGEDAFVFEIVEPVLFVEDLLVREQYWIDTLRSCERAHGYNSTPTAGSTLGLTLTDEQRAQKSERYQDPAFSAKYSAGQTARFADPAERARRSDQAKALWRDPTYRERMTARHQESHADPEYRARTAERSKQQFADPSQRARLANQANTFWKDPEKRASMSERIKAMWADPEKRKDLIERQKAGRARKKAKE